MSFAMPQMVQDALAAGVLSPSWPGTRADYARPIKQIVESDMLNSEVIRLQRAIWLAPK